MDTTGNFGSSNISGSKDGSTDKDQELEDKKIARLVGEKVRLEDGSYDYVFTRKYNDSIDTKSCWRCNVCDVSVGGSLEKHSIGRKHQQMLGLPSHSATLWGKAPPKRLSMGDLRLAPGEPVPPGFEDEVRGVTEIQTSLDAFHSGPLIGLEYLIELSAYEDEREPQYVCLLCDKRGDPRTVMAHLVSFNHRMSYLQAHFPTVFRAVSPYNTKQYRRNVQNVVCTICENIEKRFGRMAPQSADRETFERKKQDYVDNILKDTHPSERLGETFEHLVDKEVILSGPKETPKRHRPGKRERGRMRKVILNGTPKAEVQVRSGLKREKLSTEPWNQPKDAIAEIKKAGEQSFKHRNYRKGGFAGKDDKKDPSPPVVAMPAIRNKSAPSKSDRGRSLSSISSISSSSLSSPRSRTRSRSRSRSLSKSTNSRYSKSRRYPDNYRRSRSRSRSPYRRYYRRSRSYSRSPPRYRRGEPYSGPTYNYNNSNRLPWQRPEYGRSRENYHDRRPERRNDMMKNDRYDDYKKQCSALEDEMDKILDQHEKNPEKHPMYPEEWKKFWNRRYKELQAENKDPNKHDFKPEWIDFWNKRMKEMHDGELKAKKEALRKRLNLPEEPAPISFKITGKRKSSCEKDMTKKIDIPSTSDDVIVIDDSKDDEIIRERKRSHSPWEVEPIRERERDRDRGIKIDYSREYYKPSRPYREPSREREYKRMVPLSPKYMQKEPEEEINVVGVLRLLTALEEKLGSLGPRTIEMLSQALALEKAEANSAETLLDNDVNCVFFETVKEKLKGQLLAGMVELSAEKTFKNSIQKIASLLHFASERKREQDKKMQAKTAEPVKIPGIGTIDKPALAKQIAGALIAQGKTEVTQAELEQLTNAVLGMVQTSQSTGKPVSTASFIQQLSGVNMLPMDPISTTIQSSLLASVTPKTDLMSTALQMLQSSTVDTSPTFKNQNAMEGLSDSDLKTLLQNFKDLSTDEQHNLITYLKKLEAREPERVERLRKFVKLGPNVPESEKAYTSGRISPFSNREAGVNPTVEEGVKSGKNIPPPQKNKLHIDSDEDDDYSFEDVFRAASKNVSEKQLQDERNKLENSKMDKKDLGINLNDAKMLIANLMGQLGNANKNNTPSFNLLGLGPQTSTSLPTSTITTNNPISNPVNNLTDTNLSSITSSLLNNSKISNVPIKNTTLDNLNLQYPVSAITPNNQTSQSYGQYNYAQNRPYNQPYDNTYNQSYNPTSNLGYGNPTGLASNVVDYSSYGNDQRMVQDYNNTSYPVAAMSTQPRPQQSQYRSGQQYPGYDPRQNYY